MFNGQKVCNNKSVWEKKVELNLGGHVMIAPFCFQKAMMLVESQWKSYLKHEMMHGKAWKEIWLRVIQTSIPVGKKWLANVTEENVDTVSIIVYLWSCYKIALFSQFCSKLIYFLPDNQCEIFN